MRKLLLIALSACTDQLGTVEQDVTWSNLSTYDCSDNQCTTGTHVLVGPASDRTCFIAGVSGYLDADQQAITEFLVYVDSSDNNYYLLAPGAENFGVQRVTVACINTVQNRAFARATQGTTGQFAGPNGAQRRCFLTGGSFWCNKNNCDGNYLDTIAMTQFGGSWYATTSGAAVEADGVCVDVPTQVTAIGYGHDADGEVSGPITSNPGGVACGLTSLQGKWGNAYSTSRTVGMGGVKINYASGNYTWTFDNHVGAYVQCVK